MKGLLGMATGMSRAQVTRLVGQFVGTGQVVDRRGGAPPRPFERPSTAADIRLLAEADATLGQTVSSVWPLRVSEHCYFVRHEHRDEWRLQRRRRCPSGLPVS